MFTQKNQQISILFLTNTENSGLAAALREESGGKIVLREVCGSEEGMRILRTEAYDAVLVLHEPPARDAVKTVEALRTAGVSLPMIVLGSAPVSGMIAACGRAGAEDYVCTDAVTVEDLVWMIFRAVRCHTSQKENETLKRENTLRARREHEEAEKNIARQRRLLGSPANVPDTFREHYQALLKTYILMGTGDMTPEIRPFAQNLAAAGITASQVAALHLQVLESVLRHLGEKSCRHIVQRAEELRLEVLIHLSDEYQR